MEKFKVLEYRPFDPASKRVEATVTDVEGQVFHLSKGAPQAILALLAPDISSASEVDFVVQEFAVKGYRTLGVAQHGQLRAVALCRSHLFI